MSLRPLYVGRRPRRSRMPRMLLSMLLIALVGGAGFGTVNRLAWPAWLPDLNLPFAGASMPVLAGSVIDAYTSKPVSSATVTLGGEPLRVAGNGSFRFRQPAVATSLWVTAPGYEAATEMILPTTSGSLQIALRPTRLEGIVRGGDGQPLAGARVSAGSSVTVTGSDGRYTLEQVPAQADLVVEAAEHARYKEPVGTRVTADIALRPSTLSGIVKTSDGTPIANATVALGKAMTVTGADGHFRLNDVAEDGQLAVKAGGYKAERRLVTAGSTVEIVLSPFVVKAVYLTHLTTGNNKRFNEMLALVERTELNAMVIDVKGDSGHLFYESAIPLAQEIKAVAPAYDVKERLKQLQAADVYAIARVVVMEDTLLATARPEWAITHKATGKPWRDVNGIGWMNAYRTEVWEYNAAVAREVAELGFDEVQFDYVRFPSDGALAQADYGQVSNEATRTAAIASLLARTKQELDPLGVYLSADIFGLTTIAADDVGIGQKIEAIANAVDYICPMVYPSHYAKGSFGYANPAAMPYEVVARSMEGGRARLAGGIAQQRPWLQDFNLYGTPYTAEMVRAQIKASEAQGTSGWLIWNAANRYQEAAFRRGS